MRLTIQPINFLIVKPSPFPILIHFGPKSSHQGPVLKHPYRNNLSNSIIKIDTLVLSYLSD